MSKQAATTFLVGLLALAEGRSDDRNMLREATDREDVLHQVDTETLDRIAHRMFSHDQEHLNYYDHLVKDDKRQKWEYLRKAAAEDEFLENDNEIVDRRDHFQHQRQSAEDERKIKEDLIQRQKDWEHQKLEDERREQEELEKRIRDQRDEERKAAEEQEKRDEERRRRRVSQERRDKEEAYRKEEERLHALREAERQHELEHRDKQRQRGQRQKEQQGRNNNIYDRLPSLMTLNHQAPSVDNQTGHHPMVYPVKPPVSAYAATEHQYGYGQDKNSAAMNNKFRSNEMGGSDGFVIEPRFKTNHEYDVVDVEPRSIEEEKHIPLEDRHPSLYVEEVEQEVGDHHAAVEEIPFVDKRMIHRHPHEIDYGMQGDDERRSYLGTSSSESSSSSETQSSLSSSSSSTSSMSSSDTWVSDSEGFHTMDEKEVQAYESWVNERLAKQRRTHAIDEELLRYEDEQRHRQELSAGKYSDSEPTSSEGRSSARVSPRKPSSAKQQKQMQQKKRPQASKKKQEEAANTSGSERSGPIELDSGYGLSSDESDRQMHEKYEREIAAAQSDEEHYFSHYSRLQEEMQHLAEEAEKVKDEARHVAEEADHRAQSAEAKVQDAKRRASDLDRQAREAEERVAELELKLKEAEARVEQVELEYQTAQYKSLARQRQMAEEELSEEERHLMPQHHRHQPHYYAMADSGYSEDDLDFSSYGEEVASDGHQYHQARDDIRRSAEPVQYMKHGNKRHKDILARREYKSGGKKTRRAYKAKKAIKENPEAAKKAIKENPEFAKKVEKAVQEVAKLDTPMGAQARKALKWEADRDAQKWREDMGEYGHAKTAYPKEYKGPQLEDLDKIGKWDAKEDKPDRESDEKTVKRAKTVYPPEYRPPKIDDQDASDLIKPVSPMVRKHEQPYMAYHDTVDTMDDDKDNYWEAARKMREFKLRAENLDWIDRQAEQMHLKRRPNTANETIGSAMIEENEKERALELYRQKTEQELKMEYDRKVMDLTKDYQSKLKDMDVKYSEKQFELDHQRQDIEKSIESYPAERYEPMPIPAEIYERSVIPHDPRPVVSMPAEIPVIPVEIYGQHTMVPRESDRPTLEFDLHPQFQHQYRPSPHAQTFDETEFGFVKDRPVVGLNLAHKQVPNQQEKDPLADIKKREEDLQKERLERETELQADYEKRLAEFEKDYHEKEAALEKERLEQERILIAEREHQIELDQKAARKLRKKQRKAAMAPPPEPIIEDELEEDADMDLGMSEEEEDDLDDSSLLYGDEDVDDYDDEDEYGIEDIDPMEPHRGGDHYGDSFDEDFGDFNKIDEPAFSSEGEAEFFHETQDSRGQDIYEVEWELDLNPTKQRAPSSKPSTSDAPAKKDRKSSKKDKQKEGGKKDRKNKKQQPDNKPTNSKKQNKKNDPLPKSKRDKKAVDKQPKDKKSNNKKSQRNSKKNSRRQNGIAEENVIDDKGQIYYGAEFGWEGGFGSRRMDLGHEPIVTEKYGHFDGYDYGYDITGQAYKYNRYELANPAMPELPVARIPMRPAHPLDGYANAYDYYALNGAFDNEKKPEYAHPMQKGVKYPDQRPEKPEFIDSPQYMIHRERYGPQYHDRTPELIEETSKLQHHKYYDNQIYEHHDPLYAYMPAANEMQTRTFPQIKTFEYKPEDYAKSLAKAHESGNLPPKEEEVPLHRSVGWPLSKESLNNKKKVPYHHKHQTRPFDQLHKGEVDGMPAHKDHALMLDKEKTEKKKEQIDSKATTTSKAKATSVVVPEHKDLQLKIPKDIQHITDLPTMQKPHEAASSTTSGQRRKRKEEKRDVIPQADLTALGTFAARRDPFAVDIEKIALRRAAKQRDFQRKYEDEYNPWDVAHGGRFTYQGEHKAEDREMHESPQHAKLDKVFEEKEQEYHQHSLMKPRFEDFKLQFEGLHSSVADYIPHYQVVEQEKQQKEPVFKHPQKSAEKQKEDALPTSLYTGSVPMQGPMTRSYIPTEPLPVMTSSESPVQRTEHDSPLALDVMSKPLEDPSIHDIRRTAAVQQQPQPSRLAVPQVQQTYELPIFDPSTVMRQQQPVMQTTGSMYQAPTPWYAQSPAFGRQQLPVQPQYMGQASQMPQPYQSQQQAYPVYQSPIQPTMMSQPQQTMMYPSTPYMPPELTQLPTSVAASPQRSVYSQMPSYTAAPAPGIMATKALPYQPKSQTQQYPMQQAPVMMSQNPNPNPSITMTRQLTQMPQQSRRARNQLDYSKHQLVKNEEDDYDFGGQTDFYYDLEPESQQDVDEDAFYPHAHDYQDESVQEFDDDDHDDEPYRPQVHHVHHVYTDRGEHADEEHPVYVTSSDPAHTYYEHDAGSDEYIVGTYLDTAWDSTSAKFLQ